MLSEKIRALRRKSGLSQDELAERLGVSRQAVSKWELGSAVPIADTLVDIADFFGVSLDYLMRGNIDRSSDSFEPPKNANTPNLPEKTHSRRRTAAVLLLAASVFLGVIVLILYMTGAGVLGGGSGITINGTGMLAALAVMLGAAGVVLFILSIKK